MKLNFTTIKSGLIALSLLVLNANVWATDTALYQTGFEAPDFTASTTYNNTSEVAVGPTGQQWMVMEGTASTTSPITDLMSLQMRDYTANSVTPYAYTNFEVNGVKTVAFKAKNASGLNLIVSYSTDGGSTWMGAENIAVTTTATDYSYTVGDATGTDNVRIKFAVDPASVGTNKARMYIDDVVFSGAAGQTTQTATPVFTPADGKTFITSVDVTLASVTEGAAIYYTLDGSEPTTSSTMYSAPINLTATTTIKALAVKSGLTDSSIASATFTKVAPAADETVAEIRARTLDEVGAFFGLKEVTVTYVSNTNMYIQDNTGGLLIYGDVSAYHAGQVLSGTLIGTLVSYNGLLEIKNPDFTNVTAAANDVAVVPQEMTIENLIVANNYSMYESKLVKIVNAEVTKVFNATDDKGSSMTQNGSTLAMYNSLRIEGITETGAYDVTGFLARYNDNIQFTPIEIVNHASGISLTKTGMNAFGGEGVLYIHADEPSMVKVYNVLGACVRQLQVQAGETEVNGLAKGIYVVNNQKVVIK